MTSPVSMPVLATGSLPASHGSDRDRLAAAAKQFEAIFVRQMLASARKADFGDTLFSSQAMDTYNSMFDEKIADGAAQSGAFGLAKQIEAQLARFVDAPAAKGA